MKDSRFGLLIAVLLLGFGLLLGGAAGKALALGGFALGVYCMTRWDG